jgi:hypothetical protein
MNLRFISATSTLVLAIATPGVFATDLKVQLSGRGMWVQHPAKSSTQQLNALKDLGVQRLHIMVTNAVLPNKDCSKVSSPRLATKLSTLVDLIKSSKAMGFVVIATAYMPPSRNDIDAFLASKKGTAQRLIDAGVDGVEYDLEGGWSRAKVCGYETHELAAKALYDGTRALKAGVPVGVTTHLGRVRDENIGRQYTDWMSVQAYVKCQGDRCVDFEDKREGPGTRVARLSTELGKYSGLVVVGLAAYNQKWPGRTVDEAMQRSLSSAKALLSTNAAIVGHSYWSATWALRDQAVSQFLASSAK